ncbi:hypothetical protein J31TS6_62270 [Brevibacillus reuszeri]|nr:hypothetical protein J31TS6_62270 [Brevibacillus reuszeri]
MQRENLVRSGDWGDRFCQPIKVRALTASNMHEIRVNKWDEKGLRYTVYHPVS